jgi:hypothetical protein
MVASSASAAVVDLPSPTLAVAVARTGAVDVTWVSTVDAHRWKLVAFADGRYVGERTVAGTGRTGRIEHLPPGTAVSVWVVPVTAEGGWVGWTSTPEVRLPRDPACPAVTGTCVHLDARTTTGAANGAGLGLTHGYTPETDVNRLLDLNLRHWRVPALDAERLWWAKLLGPSTTVILSDPWTNATIRPDGRVASPWEDLSAYRVWVTAVASWHKEKGILPDRWEIQNEPGVHVFDPAYPMTMDLLVEQLAVASEAIRSVIPGAKIVGPSLSPFLFGHNVEDMEAFIAKAKARGLTLDSLVWHENTGTCDTCDGGPKSVLQHIDDARAALQAAGLGNLPIDITEFAIAYEQLQPGAIVGYLSALAEGGVRYGGTACWDRPSTAGTPTSSCFSTPGTLDGLLLADGKTPTDAWWTYRSFAQLSGTGAKLVRTSVDDPATSAVASVTGDTSVRALVGRHTGCTAADGPCPGGTTPGGPESVTVRMTAPAAGTWTVVVSKIVSNAGASSGATVLKTTTVTAGTSAFSIGAFTVNDGDVLQVVATRAATATTTTTKTAPARR